LRIQQSSALALYRLMIQLGGRSCIIFSLTLVCHETGKANKNVCLTETYSGVWVGQHLSDIFHIKNGFR